ncbi:MAG TPA: OB-fold domain-containing protein [Blastococcus sp.]
MEISALAMYRPAWVDTRGRRTVGPDEDVSTLAVSAGRLLDGRLADVTRVVLVTRRPDALLGTAPEVLLEGLGLAPATPVVEQVGGAPATVEALLAATAGTLVLAVDPIAPAAAAAALVGPGPLTLDRPATSRHSVPVRTIPLPGAADLVYDDPRLLRERGWKRAAQEVAGEGARPLAVAGLPAAIAAKLGHDVSPGNGALPGIAETEAAAPLLLLARAAADGQEIRLVAVENGHAVAVDVAISGPVPVLVAERSAHPAPATWEPAAAAEIPASPAAYERAFEAKVGLKAGVCSCGERHYPPRAQCVACGALDAQHLEPLPRAASIYSVVTVRAPVPGKTVPYSLAVVDLEGTGIRALVHVTDDPPGKAPIGAPGRLVLRRIAMRAGVPDYGYAFQPEEQQA